MPTSYQGASGSSGPVTGSQPAPRHPVSGNHTAPRPALTRLKQPSQEELVLNQMRKLTVRVFIDVFGLRIDRRPGGTSTPLKRPWSCRRYDSVPLTESPSDWSAEAVYEEGKDQESNWVSNLNYQWIQHLII